MTALPETPTFMTCEGVPIQVWIEVAGKKVPHYAIEYDADKKEVSCWIQSEADMPFVIKYRTTTDQYALGLKTVLDGVQSGDFVLLPQTFNHECLITGTRISTTEKREFKFGSLQFTDDDAYLENLAKAPHFGEIRTIIDKKSSFEPAFNEEYQYNIPETNKVHERSKKGLTHHVKHGEKKPANVYSPYNAISCGVLATFVFKYRPLEWLMATDIVTREPGASSSKTPKPTASAKRIEPEVKEEPDEEDEDSAGEEEKTLLAQLEKVRQRKLEKEAEGSARKKIKLEHKNHFMPDEVIDLTDDNVPAKSSRRPVVPKTPAPVIDLT